MKKDKKIWLKFIFKWLWIISNLTALIISTILFYKVNYEFFKAIDFLLIVQNGLVLATVVSIVILLEKIHPFFKKKWMSYFNYSENINFIPLKIKYLGIIFLLLAMFNLPILVTVEEVIFRRGTNNWSEGIVRSIFFGLVHCIVNAPLSVGCALSVAGLWLTYQYFSGGIPQASMHHFCYNLPIFIVYTLKLIKEHVKKAPK